MKKVKDFLLSVLAVLVALPFLVVGFVRWVFLPSPDDCIGCPYSGERHDKCDTCKSHPRNFPDWRKFP